MDFAQAGEGEKTPSRGYQSTLERVFFTLARAPPHPREAAADPRAPVRQPTLRASLATHDDSPREAARQAREAAGEPREARREVCAGAAQGCEAARQGRAPRGESFEGADVPVREASGTSGRGFSCRREA